MRDLRRIFLCFLSSIELVNGALLMSHAVGLEMDLALSEPQQCGAANSMSKLGATLFFDSATSKVVVRRSKLAFGN